jgi:hypothetical protein
MAQRVGSGEDQQVSVRRADSPLIDPRKVTRVLDPSIAGQGK